MKETCSVAHRSRSCSSVLPYTKKFVCTTQTHTTGGYIHVTYNITAALHVYTSYTFHTRLITKAGGRPMGLSSWLGRVAGLPGWLGQQIDRCYGSSPHEAQSLAAAVHHHTRTPQQCAPETEPRVSVYAIPGSVATTGAGAIAAGRGTVGIAAKGPKRAVLLIIHIGAALGARGAARRWRRRRLH
jgi:hypothetical protein